MNNLLTTNHYDTIIIGGGSSGMMAANVALGRTLILEKNSELGKKLKITGGGRCNILNAEMDPKRLLKNYGSSEKYLHTPFSMFDVQDTIDFFKNLGIEIKIEDRKRAFPKSERALDVFLALEKDLEKNKVEVKYNTEIQEIIINNYKVEGIKILKQNENKKDIKESSTKDNLENFEILTADKYIMSTGGYSHPETGSTGDGFKFLKDSGIKISEASPSLVPISVSNTWVKNLSGKTIENIKLTFYVDGIKKKIIKSKAEKDIDISNASAYKNSVENNRVLFTHFGLSGPTILNNSKLISDWMHEGEVTLLIDLFPHLDEKGLDGYLLNIFDNNKNKIFRNILNEICAGNTLEEIFLDKNNNLSDIDLGKEVNMISKSERRKLVNVFKNLKVNITGLMGFDKAIIADGGIDASEINWDNMSLKRLSNMRVTGDMINITRPSGGYSLQLCWTTGYVAGIAE